MKTILYDDRWNGKTGIGRYSEEISSYSRKYGVNLIGLNSHLSLSNPFSPIILAKLIKNHRIDKFWSPSFMPPAYSSVPFVFTIHDLIHMHFHTNLHTIYYKKIIQPLAKRAESIMTVSQYSKDELCDTLNLPKEIVKVAYLGISDIYTVTGVKYLTGAPYFLYIGNRRRHKNIFRILQAFSILCQSIPDILFVMSGEMDRNLAKFLADLRIKDRVKFLGHIKENDLPSIYRGALATVFPSLYEGFGLPIIESMACGTPVITSNITSMPEVAGNAALLVNPYDVTEIHAAYERILKDSSYSDRIRILGLERSKAFSWEKTSDIVWKSILDID